MKEYKLKQINFNLLGEFADTLNADSHTTESSSEEIIENAISYLTTPMSHISYPSKSYAVALIYSYLIEKYFHEDFWISLNDENLFCGNDLHFSPYSKSPFIYNEILNRVGGKVNILKNSELEQVQKTIGFFCEEFAIGSNYLK